ncbi:MAG: primosomal protein N' [Candidatus Gracilibacteria bacterium]|nr:primosomal protein N' [Candidatus Gracilibacteria bacterium]
MHLVNLSIDKSQINPYLSETLLSKIEEVINNGEKVILYLNKRGQFNSIICNDCQNLFKCKNCDISMSVHKYPAKLICHLCSYSEDIPISCIKCGGINLYNIGVGTQQIEDSLNKLPLLTKEGAGGRSVFRFDTDTMKTKKSKSEAIQNLEKADIIIGTKMITTGFNFDKVGLIGVILLEQELQIPKYNTEESVYINIRQLIGRGGRVGQKTDFIIQSFIPDNEIVQSIIYDNYKSFFIKTLNERKLFNYPPFGEVVTLEYRHSSEKKSLEFMQKLNNKLNILLEEKNTPLLDKEGLGVVEIIFNPKSIKKINQYYYKIIIKGDKRRTFIEKIKPEIIRNSGLNVIFD